MSQPKIYHCEHWLHPTCTFRGLLFQEVYIYNPSFCRYTHQWLWDIKQKNLLLLLQNVDKNDSREENDKYVRMCVFVPRGKMRLNDRCYNAAAYLSYGKTMESIKFLLGMCSWNGLTCCWIYNRYCPIAINCCWCIQWGLFAATACESRPMVLLVATTWRWRRWTRKWNWYTIFRINNGYPSWCIGWWSVGWWMRRSTLLDAFTMFRDLITSSWYRVEYSRSITLPRPCTARGKTRNRRKSCEQARFASWRAQVLSLKRWIA